MRIIDSQKFFCLITGITINGVYTNIRIGNETIVTCMIVPLPPNTTYKWLSQTRSIVTSSGILKLIGNHNIDESNYTCLVNSSQLYSPIEKTITVTVLGIINISHCLINYFSFLH